MPVRIISRKNLIVVFYALCVLLLWSLSIPASTVTSIALGVEAGSQGGRCDLLYSRAGGGGGSKGATAVLSGGTSETIYFPVSPKAPLEKLMISCAVSDAKFRFVALELRYLGILSLYRWDAFSGNEFIQSRVEQESAGYFVLENRHPLAPVYQSFPQNYPLKLLLSAMLTAVCFVLLKLRRSGIAGMQVAPARSCAAIGWLARVVPFGLFVIFGFAVVLAVFSPRNAHPDEEQHISATQYYMSHWLPPEIDAPVNAYLYDHYGMTRLNHWGIEYFLAGKLAAVLHACGVSQLIAIRAFNPLLIIVLFLWSIIWWRRGLALPLIIPIFFLTPQIWYTFSYMNDDAFPYVLMLVLLVQYLTAGQRHAVLFGVPLGLLMLSKANFLVFVLFMGVLAGVEILRDRMMLRRWLMIALVAFSVIGIRGAIDLSINGSNRFAKMAAAEEKYSAYELRLSTVAKDPQKSHWLKGMRLKGVPARDLVVKYSWLQLTAASFISVYGYFNIAPGEIYFLCAGILFLVFASYIIGKIVLAKERDGIYALIISVVFLLLLVGLAFYRSWNFEFQPQGRHLFPFLGIAAWLIYRQRTQFSRQVMHVFLALFFISGVYSMIFTGLPGLLK